MVPPEGNTIIDPAQKTAAGPDVSFTGKDSIQPKPNSVDSMHGTVYHAAELKGP